MMYLAYDVETTGLPLNPACETHLDTLNWPRVYQIGAILFDEIGMEYGSLNVYIKPDGWVIPKVDAFLKSLGTTDFHEEQGVTTEMLNEQGIPLWEALVKFKTLADQADAYVGHNVSFDKMVMSCEMHRKSVYPNLWLSKTHHCTKLLTEDILRIPTPWPGRYKWPTLQEAYKHFYGREFDGAHDAMADVRATMDVFLEVEYLV